MDQKEDRKSAYVSVDSLRSWLACFASFIFQCTFLAVQATYGVFMVHFLEEFPELTTSTATWVGISSNALIMFFGPVVNILSSVLGFRILLACGCILSIVSLGLCSLVTHFPLMFITYSILYGIAASIIYVSSFNACQVMFNDYIALATGLQASGASMAVLALSPVMNLLIYKIGWRQTLRYWLIVVITLPLVCLFPGKKSQKPKSGAEKHSMKISPRLLRNPSFLIWCFVSSVSVGCTASHSVHLMRLANDIHTTVHNRAFVYTAFGIGSLLGRMFGGRLLDINSISKIYLMEGVLFMYGFIQLVLSHATDLTQLLSYCLLMGVLDGIHILLVPCITYDLGNSLGDPGTAWGIVLFFNGIGYILSPTTAGSLHDLTGNYHLAFTLSGTTLLIDAFILLCMPYQQWRTERFKRAAEVLKLRQEELKLLQPTSTSQTDTDTVESEASLESFISSSTIAAIPGPAMGSMSLQSTEILKEDCHQEIKRAESINKMEKLILEHELKKEQESKSSSEKEDSPNSQKSRDEIMNVPGIGGMVPIISREDLTIEENVEDEEQVQIYMTPAEEDISVPIQLKEKKPKKLSTILEAPLTEAIEAREMENRTETDVSEANNKETHSKDTTINDDFR